MNLRRVIRENGKTVAKWIYNILFLVTKTRENIIVFDSSNGKNYTGNPKAIYECLVKDGLDEELKLIWFFRKTKECYEIPGRHIEVRFGSLKYLYYMSIAKIWVFDSRNPAFLRKRDNQHYIQTWHGTPLKKLALDLENELNISTGEDLETYKSNFYKNTRTWDYLIVQNNFSLDVFKHCFAFNGKFLLTGYPRNDILFKKNNDESKALIKNQLNLPAKKKVILYAPTYRDDEYDRNGREIFVPHLNFKKLRGAIGDEYVVAVKYHYFIENKIDWSELEGFIYPFDGSSDISLLYIASDALITDYSSVMFDYSILHRPMYFYCYDIEKYKNQLRGFYFDFVKEAPGPISTTTEGLIDDLMISKEDYEIMFREKEEAFYKKYHSYEDGFAAEKIEKVIKNIIANE